MTTNDDIHPTTTFRQWAGPDSPWQTDQAPVQLPLGRNSGELPWLVMIGDSTDSFTEDWLRSIADDADFQEILPDYCQPLIIARQQAPILATQAQMILAATAGGRGWPLLLICDSNGQAIGATPFGPLREGHGRPGTMTVVIEALAALADDPTTMASMAGQLKAMVEQILQPQAFPKAKTGLLRDSAEAGIFEAADTLNGGFGPLPRYWQPGLWDFIAARLEQTNCPASIKKQTEKTLLAAITGATWDQLGGGVFRAAADLNWATCLAGQAASDQAYAVLALTKIGRALAQPVFLQAAQQIIQSSCAGLCDEDGVRHGRGALAPLGGVGALVNAGHIAWNEAAAAAIIGAEGAGRFARVFLADEAGNLPEQDTEVDPWRVPVRRQQALDEHDAARLAVLSNRLAAARQERPGPTEDTSRYLADQGRWLAALGTCIDPNSTEPPAAAVTTQVDAVLQTMASWPTLAKDLKKWHHPEAPTADVLDLAWCVIGLSSIQHYKPSAGELLASITQSFITNLSDLHPALLSPLDEQDDLAPLAVITRALQAIDQDAQAQALLEAHAGALSAAPAAGLGVLSLLL